MLWAREQFPSAWDLPATDAAALQIILPYAEEGAFVEIVALSPPRDPSPDQAIAKPYLFEARKYALAENSASAQALLNRGLEVSPGNPDLLFALAYLDWRDPGQSAQALAVLEKAETRRDWYYCSLSAAQDFHCRLLFSLGRYKDLDKYLKIMGRNSREPWAAYWTIRLNQVWPDADNQLPFLAKALKLFPDQPKFMSLKLRSVNNLDFSDAQWFRRHASDSPEYLAALCQRIRLLKPSMEQRQCIVEYLGKNGRDPWVLAWALENILEGFIFGQDELPGLGKTLSQELTESQLIQALSISRGSQDLDVTRFVLLSLQSHGRTLDGLWDTSSPQTLLYRDQDRDGYGEEKILFRKGIPVVWARDAGQDGTLEFVCSFKDGLPWTVRSTRDTEVYAYRYAEYPEISFALVETSDHPERFFLRERALELRVMDIAETGWIDPVAGIDSFVLPPRIRYPDRGNLADEAYFLDRTGRDAKTGRLVARYERYEDGKLFAAAEDADMDGKIDVIELYDQEVLALRLESVQKPGVFERIRIYSAGKPSQTYVFSPSDRLRYHVDHNAGLEIWDVNHDQTLDYHELSIVVDQAARYFQEIM